MWNRLLIILHLRRDWLNETEYTPPAFAEPPHVYDADLDGKTLNCCALCGGGPKHPIHIPAQQAQKDVDWVDINVLLGMAGTADSKRKRGTR